MDQRTVSFRNFVGAFLGGALGILAFGYLNAFALAPGCFFGVVVGWWHKEIWNKAIGSVHAKIVSTRLAYHRFMRRFHMLAVRRRKEDRTRFDIHKYSHGVLAFLRFMATPFVWIAKIFIALVRVFKAHPMNRAMVVRSLAIVAFEGLSLLWMWAAFARSMGRIIHLPKESPETLLILPMLILPIFAMLMPPILLFNDPHYEGISEMRNFYRCWERYSKSKVTFFLHDIATMFQIQITLVSWLGGLLVWYSGVGGAFVIFIVAPVSCVVGAVKGIYEVSTKAGHWMCFGATLATTAFTAWISYPYFGDARVLWGVALFAGIASAAVTEGLRRSLTWVFKKNERIFRVASLPLYDQLAPSGRMFQRITTRVIDRLLPALPKLI